jgi:hypothetical protein
LLLMTLEDDCTTTTYRIKFNDRGHQTVIWNQ